MNTQSKIENKLKENFNIFQLIIEKLDKLFSNMENGSPDLPWRRFVLTRSLVTQHQLAPRRTHHHSLLRQ